VRGSSSVSHGLAGCGSRNGGSKIRTEGRATGSLEQACAILQLSGDGSEVRPQQHAEPNDLLRERRHFLRQSKGNLVLREQQRLFG
jgi:hypothetical protein